LGARSNAVFLRTGEFEMFERATFDMGIQRVRTALTNGLSAAEEALAQGLLAESTTNALASFRRALELDPSFHSAHRHSLGLEFVLGRHEELSSHLETLRTIHRGEFSPGFIEAAELALHGHLANAQANLAALNNRTDPDGVTRVFDYVSNELIDETYEAVDVDQNGAIELGGSDRVTLYKSGSFAWYDSRTPDIGRQFRAF